VKLREVRESGSRGEALECGLGDDETHDLRLCARAARPTRSRQAGTARGRVRRRSRGGCEPASANDKAISTDNRFMISLS
jgi:hypothetical protein